MALIAGKIHEGSAFKFIGRHAVGYTFSRIRGNRFNYISDCCKNFPYILRELFNIPGYLVAFHAFKIKTYCCKFVR